eukprot:scaffold55021_cov48-Attheya_sp.AAC.1
MADLNNLLDELDVSTSQDDDLNDVDESRPSITSNDADDALEDDFRPAARIPAALVEAQREAEEHADFGSQTEKEELNQLDKAEALPEEDAEYTALKRLWCQELCSPELLPRNADIMDIHMELLPGQDETVDELTAEGGDNTLASLAASIYKMDADRLRFLLADVTRTRLAKIENSALYMRDHIDRMSPEEIEHLRNYGELLERHFRRTVLDHLPKDAWKKLDEPEMIDGPDLDEFVFCRVLETVEIDPHLGETNNSEDENMEDSIQEHPAGSCLIARYRTIQDFVFDGKIELLI